MESRKASLRRLWAAVLALAVALVAGALAPAGALAADTQQMYRCYNPNSGEHFYTAKAAERDHIVSLGWKYEGVGWTAPVKSNSPVYRLYNPNAGDHHYTLSASERDHLVSVGWKYEGIGWYSDDAKSVPLYRQYNPNAQAGAHNFTTNKSENDYLVKVGWRAEGISWYGVDPNAKPTSPTKPTNPTKPTEATYTVTFNANGGTGTMASKTYTVGKNGQLPGNNFTYAGKRFVGWNTRADGTGETITGYIYEDSSYAGKTVTLSMRSGSPSPTR